MLCRAVPGAEIVEWSECRADGLIDEDVLKRMRIPLPFMDNYEKPTANLH